MSDGMDAAVEAATHEVRMILLGTGALTLAEVDRSAEPLARGVLARVCPLLVADAVADSRRQAFDEAAEAVERITGVAANGAAYRGALTMRSLALDAIERLRDRPVERHTCGPQCCPECCDCRPVRNETRRQG